jgi:hypothetical protein
MKGNSNIDFIGIGYAKSGTSYIYKQLNAHPEISLSEIKELRYLNESWFLPKGNWVNKLFSSSFHYKQYRGLLKARIRYWSKHPRNIRHDHWYRRYLLGRHSDKWYASLFDKDMISGELTPAYVYMPEDEVKKLSVRFPHLKIIIMLRNPAERTWSHVKMNLAKHSGRDASDLTSEEIDNRMKEVLRLNPLYSQSVPLWKKYFNNVFIGFHDDLIERPSGLIRDILEFLGVSNSDLTGLDVHEKVNVGVRGIIPQREDEFLRAYFKDEIKFLAETTDWPYINKWI